MPCRRIQEPRRSAVVTTPVNVDPREEEYFQLAKEYLEQHHNTLGARVEAYTLLRAIDHPVIANRPWNVPYGNAEYKRLRDRICRELDYKTSPWGYTKIDPQEASIPKIYENLKRRGVGDKPYKVYALYASDRVYYKGRFASVEKAEDEIKKYIRNHSAIRYLITCKEEVV